MSIYLLSDHEIANYRCQYWKKLRLTGTKNEKYPHINDVIKQNTVTYASFDVVTLVNIAIALWLATSSKPGISTLLIAFKSRVSNFTGFK